MGAWGTKIFDDDVALDIKGCFEDALENGKSVRDATDDALKTCAQYFQDKEDAPVAYWALALLQLENGGLTEKVRTKALHYITDGADLERWKEESTPRSFAARKKAIDQLHEYLLHPETFKPKQRRKRKEQQKPYHEGDWFAVPLGDGTYAVGILARVAKLKEYHHTLFAYFFGPKRTIIPSLSELISFKPDENIYYTLFTEQGFMKGEWPIIGRHDGWDRTKWSLPIFSMRLDSESYHGPILLEMDDENPGLVKNCHPSTEKECNTYWGPGLSGYTFVEDMLSRILSGEHVEKYWDPLKHTVK